MDDLNLVYVNGAAFTRSPKLDASGSPLYLLPQPDTEEAYTAPLPSIQTTENTGVPVMIVKQVPHLDANGVQMTYEVTQAEEQADGSFLQVGTGQFLKLFVTAEEQNTDSSGQPLYWKAEQETRYQSIPQPPLEIAASDARYTADLEAAYVLTAYTPPPPPIEDVRSQKIAELQVARDRAIYSTFTSSALGSVKTYNYDQEAAENFHEKALKLSFDTSITSVSWYTVEDQAFTVHTRDQFVQVLKDAGNREESLKMEYYQLEATVENAYINKDASAISAVVW